MIWDRLISEGQDLVTTNYVALESIALIQRRMGHAAAQSMASLVPSFVRTIWIDATIHNEASRAWAFANRRDLSLTDCVSFVVARSLGMNRAFAFDRHFEEQGFALER